MHEKMHEKMHGKNSESWPCGVISMQREEERAVSQIVAAGKQQRQAKAKQGREASLEEARLET